MGGDGDEEQMERAELMTTLALARRIRLYGPHDHEHEWVDADAQGMMENVEKLEGGVTRGRDGIA